MIIKCKSLDKSVELEDGSALLFGLLDHDIPIAASCRGAGACKWCKIKIISADGELPELTEPEKKAGLGENERLACQCRPTINIEIDTTYW